MTLQLLSDRSAVDTALSTACDWCDTLTLATPAAVENGGKWPVWRALERNASKIRAAYVALDGMRSDPAALEWFQKHDALRFVPAADDSFRAHVFRFQKGDTVRVMLGAGALAPGGLMAPLDATMMWEGAAVDAFALSIDALFGRAREKAHGPSREELGEYAEAFYQGADLWEQLVELGAPFIRTTARDAHIPELELVTEKKVIARAMKTVREQLLDVATDRRRQKVGYHGGSGVYTIHWSSALKMWALFDKFETRFWNAFGVTRPDPDKSLQITVEVNPPLEGVDRKVGGAFARNPDTDDIYLVHRGRIGGGQKGVGAELFWSRFRGGVRMREPGKGEPARVVAVGKVGAPDFARDSAGFVHEVSRIKRGAS